MKYLALIILLACTILSVSIYFTKNYQYRDYVIKAKSNEVKVYNVNVNLADWYELSNLPGIGESLAKRIVEDRETNGRFESVEDLLRVKGIGQAKFDKFKKYLTMEVTI